MKRIYTDYARNIKNKINALNVKCLSPTDKGPE